MNLYNLLKIVFTVATLKNINSFQPTINLHPHNYMCNCSCLDIDIKPSDCWHNEIRYSINETSWIEEEDAECTCYYGKWIDCD